MVDKPEKKTPLSLFLKKVTKFNTYQKLKGARTDTFLLSLEKFFKTYYDNRK